MAVAEIMPENGRAFIVVDKDSFLTADIKEAITLQFPHSAVLCCASVDDAAQTLQNAYALGAVFVPLAQFEENAAWLIATVTARGGVLVVTGAQQGALGFDSEQRRPNVVALARPITNDMMTDLFAKISDHRTQNQCLSQT